MVDYKELKDQELWELLHEGSDGQAYAEIYLRYFVLLRRFIAKSCGDDDDASDIAQNILIKLWERHTEIDLQHGLHSYLFRAALNRVQNHQKRERVVAAYESDFRLRYDEAYASTDDIIAVKEINETVGRALTHMNPKMRLIFMSSRFRYMDSAEISRELGIPRDTVRHQIMRALSLLRKMGLKLNSLFF